jgi:hypothetical protein
MKPEEIAQWVIDNRYHKSEREGISDFEMFHEIMEKINNVDNISMAKKLITCAVYSTTYEYSGGEFFIPKSNHENIRNFIEKERHGNISRNPIGFWDFEISFLDTISSKTKIDDDIYYWDNTWNE